jgi:hypothetical protein
LTSAFCARHFKGPCSVTYIIRLLEKTANLIEQNQFASSLFALFLASSLLRTFHLSYSCGRISKRTRIQERKGDICDREILVALVAYRARGIIRIYDRKKKLGEKNWAKN